MDQKTQLWSNWGKKPRFKVGSWYLIKKGQERMIGIGLVHRRSSLRGPRAEPVQGLLQVRNGWFGLENGVKDTQLKITKSDLGLPAINLKLAR